VVLAIITQKYVIIPIGEYNVKGYTMKIQIDGFDFDITYVPEEQPHTDEYDRWETPFVPAEIEIDGIEIVDEVDAICAVKDLFMDKIMGKLNELRRA